MSLQVQTAYNAFGRLKRDISDVPLATFNEWCDFVNKFAYRKLIETDPERFLSSTTYTVTTYPQTESLPADFKNILPEGAGFFVRDSNGDDTTRELARTGFGSNVAGYYLSGDNLIFTGMDSGTIVLRYIPTQTQITALTDYFTVDATITGTEIILEEYLDYAVKAIDVLYTQWDDDVSSESFADARFVRVLNEMIEGFRKDPDVYGLQDFTHNY
jgi:hypothetical protein